MNKPSWFSRPEYNIWFMILALEILLINEYCVLQTWQQWIIMGLYLIATLLSGKTASTYNKKYV